MTEWIVPLAAGFGAGILSAWGVGGGTLLLLVMTLVLDVPPEQAAAVNLLYFLPTGGMGLVSHWRGGMLRWDVLRRAVPWGVAAAVCGALAASVVEMDVLRRPFGVYLLLAGAGSLREWWRERKRR